MNTKFIPNDPNLRFSFLFVALALLPVVSWAQASATPNRAYIRPAYPLKVSANHRYLVDQNNMPFLIVGDSPQDLMSQLTEEEADSYFADRQAHGFNTMGWIDVTCAGPDSPDNKDSRTVDGILPFTGYVAGGTDYEHYDLTKPNEAYFTRLDHMVMLAEKHGILVFSILWRRTDGFRRCAITGRRRIFVWTISRQSL